jgi:ribose transport system substrate-binding protein
MPRNIRATASLALAGAVTVALLAACTAAPQDGGDASGGPTGGAGDGVAYAQSQIEKYEASPAFEAQGPAFDASAAEGKSVFFIPNTSNIPFVVAVQKAFEAIAEEVGIDLTVWPTTGKPTEWVQGIEQAIAQNADLVVLAAPPQLLEPQLQQLADAEIPVVVPHQYDTSMPLPENVTAFGFAPFIDAARLMADFAIVETGGAANTLVITTNESPPSKPMAEAIADEFANQCPDCKITEVNVPAPDWGSKMQSEVQTALLRDPEINFIIPIFDSATQFVVPGLTAAGKSDSVGIATFNNTPFVLEMVQQGGPVKMDVGESITWIGYATMDQALRILSGEPPLDNASAPLRVFTADNADELGTPADNEKGYDPAFIDGYLELWGLKG